MTRYNVVPKRWLIVGLAVSATMGSLAVAAVGDDDTEEHPKVLSEVVVTANDVRAPRAQNSPMLAAEPGDPRFVVLAHRLDAPEFGCNLQISGDGGRSWVGTTPVPELPEGAERCYAPEVAFGPDGVLYFLFVGLSGPGNSPMGVFLTSSNDRARTFSNPRRILGGENYQVRMVIDGDMGQLGRLHLVWLATAGSTPLGGLPPPPNPILAAHSDDGGRTFSVPVQVNGPNRHRVVAPSVVVAPDHAVHILYYDLNDDVRDYQGLEGPTWEGTWSLFLASSFDAGGQFQESVLVDDEVVPPERVMLIYTMPPPALLAGDNGSLLAAWYDARNGDWDVFVRSSDDRGRSWAPALRINDDAPRNGSHQYLPALSIGPRGRIDAIFYDRRDDPGNIKNNVYYTFSLDRGQTFAPNVRLTSKSSHSRSGQRYLVPSAEGLVEFGSRIALRSQDDGVLAAWTDTRNATFPPYQDIFATQALFPSSGSTAASWLARFALAAGAMVTVAGVLLLRHGQARRGRSETPDATPCGSTASNPAGEGAP